MRVLALIASFFALAACTGGYDVVADGTPVYDGNKIVRWTEGTERYSANVRPGQPYVGCGGRCVEMNR